MYKRQGVKSSFKLVPHFGVKVHALLGVGRGGYLIVHQGGDCRCEVSFQSYSLSNVGLGLGNAHFWGFLSNFSVGGGDLLTCGVRY